MKKALRIILMVMLTIVGFYLAYVDYKNIDWNQGMTWARLILVYYSKFVISGALLIIFILIEVLYKRRISSLYLVLFIGLGLITLNGWLRLNNKQYLAFFELILPVPLIYLISMDIKEWWYLSKTAKFLEKLKYFLTHNFILRIDNEVRIFHFIKIKITRRRREYTMGYLFISLWLVGLFVFMLYPIIYSFYLSFTKATYNAQQGGLMVSWIGFNNYLNIFKNQTIMPKFSNYLIKIVLAVPLIIIFSLIIALLINQPIKGKGIFRTIFFLPVIIASGPIILELTHQNATTLPSFKNSQALSFIMDNLGAWVANPLESLLNSLLLVLWYAGVPILIFLAGLQKTDQTIYEAASIDGAGPWERFWKITLPSIKPLISIAIIYVVVSMSLFVDDSSVLMDARLHMLGATMNPQGYGFAAAISWIYLVLMLVVMGVYIGLLQIKRKVKRWV